MAREIQTTRAWLDDKLEPIRERLLSRRETPSAETLEPMAAWDFSTGLQDLVGNLPGTMHGSAKLAGDALLVDGGFVTTSALPRSLKAKTLVATVQLDDLQQRGGGVMTVQTLDGNVFDSIVFGERQPSHWLAGSNHFARTQDLGGRPESSADQEPVQLALVYEADGTIRAYRNGVPYGEPYRQAPLQVFAANNTQVVFGLRHGAGGSGRLLHGKIFSAQLYDRALSTEEIAAVAKQQAFVRDVEVLAELSDEEVTRVKQQREVLKQREQQRDALGAPIDDAAKWTRVAHALFNLKEFVYLQ